MHKRPRVKEVLKAAEAGIEGIKAYFEQENMEVDPDTWCGHIKKSVDKGLVVSVLAEIELIQEKFNNYVPKEERRDSKDN